LRAILKKPAKTKQRVTGEKGIILANVL